MFSFIACSFILYLLPIESQQRQQILLSSLAFYLIKINDQVRHPRQNYLSFGKRFKWFERIFQNFDYMRFRLKVIFPSIYLTLK